MSYRKLWPQAELREIDQEEALMLKNEVEVEHMIEKPHYFLEWKPTPDVVDVHGDVRLSHEKEGEVEVVEEDKKEIVTEGDGLQDIILSDQARETKGEVGGVNDFHDYMDEMEFGEDSRHIDGEIPGNVESQTAHINEGATCYPNEGITDEELGLIVEDTESEGDFEDEQVQDDDCELPPMHEYEEEEDDDEVDFDVENEQVQAVCRVNGCPFKVFCSNNGSQDNMSIKTISGAHTCGPVIKSSQGSFMGQILAGVGLDADNGIYPLASAIVEWIVMTDQQKDLENVISAEIPLVEYRLCVKHLHANSSKRFSRKAYKDMMWEAARASIVQ
ncbi:hypothetical protein LIER_17372 [Lithospermum erythrorhizon]|uniref:Transposase n=1 Tax=Lithospermum erythrorhizon TaxID=34254 RepID=A0AAV3QCL0_LITER